MSHLWVTWPGIWLNTHSCRNVFCIFLNLWHDLKNDVLTYILTYFCQKSGQGATLLTPLPLDFAAITDNPRVGEVPPGCGSQSCMAPVRIPISFWSWAMLGRVRRWWVLSWAWPLALSKWTFLSSKTSSLYSTVTHHTRYPLHGSGSFNLDLISLLLFVRKLTPILPHQVFDAPRGSQFIKG